MASAASNSDADAEAHVTVVPERQREVEPHDGEGDEGQIQEEAVRVHEDEGEAVLHPVAAVDGGLAHGTGWRVSEEGLVVGAAEVVAGGAEEDLHPEDQDGRREPGGQDGLAEGDRVERRVVALRLVREAEERDEEDGRDGRVDDEGGEPQGDGQRSQRTSGPRASSCRSHAASCPTACSRPGARRDGPASPDPARSRLLEARRRPERGHHRDAAIPPAGQSAAEWSGP